MKGRIGIVGIRGHRKSERDIQRKAKAQRLAKVVFRENIGVVYASGLDRMIRFYVEQCIHFVPTIFYSCQLSLFVLIFDFST